MWRLDRLGRSLKHLIETVTELQQQQIAFKSITDLHMGVVNAPLCNYFQKSAEGGLKAAQQHLGVLYALGKGVWPDFDLAVECLRRGRGENANPCLNFLAQVLSTSPDDSCGLRSGDLAIIIAEKLVELLGRPVEYLETLAAAYAEAERFEDAIKIQQELLSKVKQQKRLSQNKNITLGHCQKRLQNYMHKKPWRDDSLSLRLYYEE